MQTALRVRSQGGAMCIYELSYHANYMGGSSPVEGSRGAFDCLTTSKYVEGRVVVSLLQSVALRLVCPVRQGCLVDSVGGGVGRYP